MTSRGEVMIQLAIENKKIKSISCRMKKEVKLSKIVWVLNLNEMFLRGYLNVLRKIYAINFHFNF